MRLITKKQSYDLTDRTLIMGIINVTPDSFSDGGNYNTVKSAIEQAVKLEKDGAHILDIGGESTRPNHEPVSQEEEIARVVPIIREVKKHVSIPISIDTYKAETAKAALDAGADMINDVWGAKREPDIAKVAKMYNVPIILMHNRTNMNYQDLIPDMLTDLEESINIALDAGVLHEQIIIDPGIGFAKTAEHNLLVMNQLERFSELGYPLLLGTSRKRFIGHILDEPLQNRDIGTGATTCMGVMKGVQIIRVHDVKTNGQLAKMMDAMLHVKRG
ncbi:dihydropteroate synthase [Virgibacillus dokdonensis]|nr:dihydropteroate synthase [Virgibacillus dokdonensis]